MLKAVINLEELAAKTIINYGLFKNIRPECRPILAKALQRPLMQAVIDDHRDQVRDILDAYPDLLLLGPLIKPVESHYTWQKFYVESPLKIALIRNQVEMVKVLFAAIRSRASDAAMGAS